MTGCNPAEQALERRLQQTDEEWREEVGEACDRIPADRLIKMIEGYLK